MHMDSSCPRCTGAPKLVQTDLKGITIDICGGCRGILMSREEVETAVSIAGQLAVQRGKDASGYFERVKERAEFLDRPASVLCPCCRYNMYEVESYDIVVDFCLNCQAVWFDEGELKSTLKIARNKGAIDLIPQETNTNETASLICLMLDTVSSD